MGERGWLCLFVAGVVTSACRGTGVREIRGAGDERVYEARCKSSAADCIADARSTCSSGYELLDSESHAGGLLADALPGPVTWYAMTFRCDVAGSSERPEFPFRGARYVEAEPAPEPAAPARRASYDEGPTATPSPPPRNLSPSPPPPTSGARQCSSDIECGPGNLCAKAELAMRGTCARAVDQSGVPTFAPPRPNSIGSGEGQCMFDTDCPVTFRCIKGSALRGNCMK
jgi:hypothetical protein